jgi:hypothetical protein
MADLEGDGTAEMLVATDEGWLLALNLKGERLWGVRLPATPMALATAGVDGAATFVLSALEDGTVLVVDAGGREIGHAQAEGLPRALTTVKNENGTMAVVATEEGTVAAWALPRP